MIRYPLENDNALCMAGTVYAGVKNATFINCTMNRPFWGVRVKVSPHCQGFVRDILYKNIKVTLPSKILKWCALTTKTVKSAGYCHQHSPRLRKCVYTSRWMGLATSGWYGSPPSCDLFPLTFGMSSRSPNTKHSY